MVLRLAIDSKTKYMAIIAIDFSINSTAICVQHNNKLDWYNIVSNLNLERKPFIVHKELAESSDNVHIIGYERNKPKDLDYSDEQSFKISNADLHSDIIISALESHISGFGTIITFEGYSYGSKGNSFIDLIAYNTFLKTKIMMECHNGIQVVAPKSVKKHFTGNGNAGKPMMVNSFRDRTDTILKNDPVHNYISSLDFGDNVPKPIDDLVDAFAILKYTEDRMKRS